MTFLSTQTFKFTKTKYLVYFSISISMLIVVLYAVPTKAVTGIDFEEGYVSDEILVKYKAGIFSASQEAIEKRFGVTRIATIPGLGVQVIKITDPAKYKETLRQYKTNPDVEYAEPNGIRHVLTSTYTPNDPSFSLQWGLYNDGSNNGKIDADIDAREPGTTQGAWDIARGSQNVIIAIIDTGVDLYHSDLDGNLWTNNDDFGDNVDDDSNGYIDDIYGWNFVGNSNLTMDDYGHGTHVAGIVAAETNNAVGVSGVAGGWGSSEKGCKIMPVKVLGSDGFGTSANIASGIIYATDNIKSTTGARGVINMSLGGYVASITEESAMKYAFDNNMVVVSAAGNDGVEVGYPAAYDDYGLGVAATDRKDNRWTSSNNGKAVDCAAPGVDIYSTLPTYDTTLSSLGYSKNYDSLSGTSMAAPHAAGLAGLVLAKNSTNFAMTNGEVMGQVRFTAEDINSSTYSGDDDFIGDGRINAYLALTTSGSPRIIFDRSIIDDSNTISSANDGDGIIEPGEKINLTVYLKNEWINATSVTGTLTTTNSNITISDSSASFGSISGGQTGNNSSDPFVFDVQTGASSRERIDWTLNVTAQYNSGASVYTTGLHFSLYIGKFILLVDDDGGGSFETFFKTALDANNFVYDVWDAFNDHSDQGPRETDMAPYKIVIWNTGLDFGFSDEGSLTDDRTISSRDKISIMKYLEDGGRLFLISQDVLYDLQEATAGAISNAENEAFIRGYLKVSDYEQDVGDGASASSPDGYSVMTGIPGDPITDGMVLSIDNASFGNWADEITPETDSITILNTDNVKNINSAGLRHASHYAVVFFVFPFEAVQNESDPNNRNTLMKRVIDWLDSVQLESDIQSPFPPTDLVATAGEGFITLNWASSPETDVKGYYIHRRTSFLGSYQVLNSSSLLRTNSYKDTDVASGQIYSYVVTAVDETNQNESNYSNEASAFIVELSSFSSSGGGSCFIATSAFGTPLAEEVQVLSRFRDEYLLQTKSGRRLVSIYYKIGPLISHEVEKSDTLKSVVRATLRPFVWLCRSKK